MAAAITDPAVALTETYRQQQITQGMKVAALVALYYKTRVDIEDPTSVERWLALVLPRIIGGRDSTARLAAAYATALRRIEAPKAESLSFAPSLADANITQALKTSLMVVGPTDYLAKATEIKQLDIPESTRAAMLYDAKSTTADKLVGATMRHVQNGGRQTIADTTKRDALVLGYVRVTKAQPCFFCAMLASRGLVFADDSFALSDPRFTGDGTAKVHDNCTCSLKPVYTRKGDKLLEATDQFADFWKRWGHGQKDSVNSFRRGYETWVKTGQVVDLKDLAA